ncbi:MAG: DUF1501 domain-containing protein [Thermonemataceae bacterium]|nr:DUF1501 domain-containing protein [Thermonemataceae bacterium]
MKRRDFLKQSALATVGTYFIPSFLKAFNQGKNNFNNKKLVIIQLSGGNDGLNTIIPFENDLYYQARPRLAIPKTEVIKLSDNLGLHPAMEKFQLLFKENLVSILNNVGYPNPDRSHFRSMDIWHTASESNEYLHTGWIGRLLDAQCQNNCQAFNAIEVDDTLSLALKGDKTKGLALREPEKFYKMAQRKQFDYLGTKQEDNIDYLYKTLSETHNSAAYIYEKNKIKKQNNTEYPNDDFAQRLKIIAQMIHSGIETSIYYVSLSGFDTHTNQENTQKRLLSVYSEAIYSFVTDLKAKQNLDNTLILTFSEFGRRVEENASGGTDHGTANNLFIIGNSLKKTGFYNNQANLSDLDGGDIKYSIDFRNIYATLLKKHLTLDDAKILNRRFEYLDFI